MIRFRILLLTLVLAAMSGCASDGAPPPIACNGNCNTHEQGYQWAMQAALTDPAPCNNPTYAPAFVLGCKDAVNDFSQLQPASKGL